MAPSPVGHPQSAAVRSFQSARDGRQRSEGRLHILPLHCGWMWHAASSDSLSGEEEKEGE